MTTPARNTVIEQMNHYRGEHQVLSDEIETALNNSTDLSKLLRRRGPELITAETHAFLAGRVLSALDAGRSISTIASRLLEDAQGEVARYTRNADSRSTSTWSNAVLDLQISVYGDLIGRPEYPYSRVAAWMGLSLRQLQDTRDEEGAAK